MQPPQCTSSLCLNGASPKLAVSFALRVSACIEMRYQAGMVHIAAHGLSIRQVKNKQKLCALEVCALRPCICHHTVCNHCKPSQIHLKNLKAAHKAKRPQLMLRFQSL